MTQEILLRTPLHSHDLIRKVFDRDRDLIKNIISFFKEPVNFSALRHANIHLANCVSQDVIDDQALLTLTGYFLRMCYRATPFGIMALVTPGAFGDHSLTPLQQINIFRKQSYRGKSNREEGLFRLNPALVNFMNGFLYFVSDQNGENSARRFVKEDWYDFLADALLTPKPFISLVNILQEAGLSQQDSNEFLNELIESEFIISEPSESYFKPKFQHITHDEVCYDDDILAIGAERAEVPKTYQENINNVLPVIRFFQTDRSKKRPESKFYNWFMSVYQDSTVQLNKVCGEYFLDSELESGERIGFVPPDNDTYAPPPSNHSALDPYYFAIYRYALQSKQRSVDVQKLIPSLSHLTDKFTGQLFVNLYQRNNKEVIFVKPAPAFSGGALTGRFATVDPEIHRIHSLWTTDYLKEYPDKVYAEIYVRPTNKNQHQVSVRPLSTRYVIELDPVPAQDQVTRININNLTIGHHCGALRLYDTTLKMEVVPVMNTPLNFQTKINPLHEIIMAVYNSRIPVSGYFSWGSVMGNTDWLPEVRYGSVVLSKECWILTKPKSLKSFDAFYSFMQAWRKDRDLPMWLDYENHDQVFPVNLDSKWSLKYLYKQCKKRDVFYLTPSFLNYESIIKYKELPYSHQLILNIQ